MVGAYTHSNPATEKVVHVNASWKHPTYTRAGEGQRPYRRRAGTTTGHEGGGQAVRVNPGPSPSLKPKPKPNPNPKHKPSPLPCSSPGTGSIASPGKLSQP